MNGCIHRDAEGRCRYYSDEKNQIVSYCAPEGCNSLKPSWSDMIRIMTDEEMADLIFELVIDRNVGVPADAWLQWLQSEAK